MGKSCKKCKAGKRRTSRSKNKVSGFDTQAAFDFDFQDIAEMAVGAVGVNLVANPILNAIWNKDKGKVRPSWAALAVKGGLAIGLNSLDNRMAKNAAKGILINIASELVNRYAPSSMQDKLKADSVLGYNEDIEYIDLAGELSGIDDSMFSDVSGVEEMEETGVYGGW